MNRETAGPCRLLLLSALAGLLLVAVPVIAVAAPQQPASVTPADACPPCDDHNPCTVDTCDVSTGTCHYYPLDCNDGNSCTTDSCQTSGPDQGGCQHLSLPAGTGCDDGSSCTTSDLCTAAGQCQGTQQAMGTSCDDRNSCTTNDACDVAGACRGTDLSAGAACNDASACTTGAQCFDTGAGLICAGTAIDCSDGVPCTVDACDPATGACSHPPVDCDDANACSIDSCDPATGACRHANAGGACSDGTACTIGDTCQGGNCVGGAPSCSPIGCMVPGFCSPVSGACGPYHPDPARCPPSTECTTWVCNPNGSCSSGPSGNVTCHDGNLCQVGQCGGGFCHIQFNLCDDNNPCTDDACLDPATGACAHANNSAPCTLTCFTGSTCGGGTCQGGTPSGCTEEAVNIALSNSSPIGKGSGTLSWDTTHEVDLSGFNVVVQNNDGSYSRVNSALIPCQQCSTGASAHYSFIIPKHKSGRDLFIELRSGNGGLIGRFGPPAR